MDNQNIPGTQVFLVNVSEDATTINVRKTNDIETTLQINLENAQTQSTLCRTCATNSDYVIPIFQGEGLQNNLADKIHQYLPIQVTTEDCLPLVMCYQCASTLLAWHELDKCCRRADQLLREMWQRQTIQTEGPSTSSNSGILQQSAKPDNQSETCRVSFEDLTGAQRAPERAPAADDDGIVSDDDRGDDDDDTPLAVIANRKPKTDLYNNFYAALQNFRDHFVTEHTKSKKEGNNYPDFTDSGDSTVTVRKGSGDEDAEDAADKYDDLTDANKRKDKMTAATRRELNEARTDVDGKTFYSCRLCHKNLSSTHTYLYHQRIHTGERPCVCHVCGKQFRVPNTLHRHLTETHEGLRRHACSVCHKAFGNSQNLKHHMRIHTGERPYVCSDCGKRFTQSGALHIHMKMHSEHCPFVCVECGAKFKVKSELVRHGLKHTGERPHACYQCPKSFKTRYHLTVHLETHAGGARFACAACAGTFATRRALRRHAKRVHEIDQFATHY